MKRQSGLPSMAQGLMLGALILSGQTETRAQGASATSAPAAGGEMTLYAVKYGESLFPAAQFFKGDATGRKIPIAWMFYAVKAGTETILVDTGFSDAEEAKKFGVSLFPYQPALAAMGVTTDSVTKIVLTHTHFDHAANASIYPNATVIVNRREAKSPLLAKVRADRLVTFDESYQVVDGMTVRRVGGHSKGSSYVDLMLGGKRFLLAGDEAYLPENVAELIPIGAFTDSAANFKFLTMAKNSGATVLTFHDPALVKAGYVLQIAPRSGAR